MKRAHQRSPPRMPNARARAAPKAIPKAIPKATAPKSPRLDMAKRTPKALFAFGLSGYHLERIRTPIPPRHRGEVLGFWVGCLKVDSVNICPVSVFYWVGLLSARLLIIGFSGVFLGLVRLQMSALTEITATIFALVYVGTVKTYTVTCGKFFGFYLGLFHRWPLCHNTLPPPSWRWVLCRTFFLSSSTVYLHSVVFVNTGAAGSCCHCF